MEKEIKNIIFDTLMGNTNNEQLDISSIENQKIDGAKIEFNYKCFNVFMVIKITELSTLK